MRISIPNLIPTLGYLMFLTIGVVIAVAFIQTYGKDGVGMTIFFILFECICIGMLGLLSFRFKLVYISESEVAIIRPFRLKISRIKLNEIHSLNCELMEAPLWVNYQKIIIKSSSLNVSFSDFEFGNFNSLIERIPLDTYQLAIVRKRVAKNNRILNFILIPIFSFFIFMAISQLTSGVTHPIPKINLVVSSIISLRLISQLLVYNKWLSQSIVK